MHSNLQSRLLLSPDRTALAAPHSSPLQRMQFIAKDIRDFIALSSRRSLQDNSDGGTFEKLALKLFHAQFGGNADYRRFCESRRLAPESVRAFSEIPAIPAVAFKEVALTSLPESMQTAVFHSSGTTEQRPSRHFHSDESLVLYERSLLGYFRTVLRETAAFASIVETAPLPILMLTPSPADAPNSSLVHMFATVRGELGNRKSLFAGRVSGEGWELALDKAVPWLQEAHKNGEAIMVFGTAFSFVHLADALGQHAINLPPGSVAMETGGYKGRSRVLPREELHRLISERLGFPASHILCEYGMSELSSQAYAGISPRPGQRIFHFPPWARAQIISPESGREVGKGETGLIRIFDLANVYSVMAIQTEDLGIRRGNGFELLGRATSAEARGCSLMSV